MEEEAQVAHKLYGALSAHEACSAGIWLRLARMEIDWALAQGRIPVVTGGTGLYLRALMQGIVEVPDVAPVIRAQARSDLEAMGNPAFHGRLAEIDPVLAARLQPGDTQRMLRGYEVWLGTGRPLSAWQEVGATPPYAAEQFEIHKVELPRETLYARCDARLEAMITMGALDEVRDLLALPLPSDAPALRIIGVPEFGAYLRGEIPLNEALTRAQQATRNYAKRQMTWFRHQMPAS